MYGVLDLYLMLQPTHLHKIHTISFHAPFHYHDWVHENSLTIKASFQ